MNATALRHTLCWRNVPRVSGFLRTFPLLAVSLATLYAVPAQAQAPAWPTDQPNQQAGPGGPAWPSDAPRPSPTGVAPGGSGGFGPPQGSFGPAQGGMGQPQGVSPPGGPGGGPPPELLACLEEFKRLRAEVDKKGKIAKAVSERKGSAQELCSALGGILSANVIWTKFASNNAARCGIPPDAIKQIKTGEDNLIKLRTRVCAAAANGGGGGGPPRPPSLSEALGTTRLPDKDNTTVKRGGTLDTLTGNPIR